MDINAFCADLKALLSKYEVKLVCSDPYEYVEFIDVASIPSSLNRSVFLEDGSTITYHYPSDLA